MIDKILNASTGHITEEDVQLLEKESHFSVGNFEYGFFLFTQTAKHNPAFDVSYSYEYSKAFQELVALAERLGCRYICLDRDAEYIPGLPTFDW